MKNIKSSDIQSPLNDQEKGVGFVLVKNAVMKIGGIHDCDVKITFEPEWNRDSISDTGKLELGFI